MKTAELNAEQQLNLCARCHSRRLQLGDFRHGAEHLLDSIIPELLMPPLYYDDGQIRDEVFVYGSFVQSKMYRNGVRCSDCHDVHSLKPSLDGNALCLQCHRAAEYDTATHHFHRQEGETGQPLVDPAGQVFSAVGEGAQCVQCHLPGQYYMQLDKRRDHSLRVPRPDLTQALGVPNACNQCHYDQTVEWAVDHCERWYGLSRKPHYGTTLAAGRNRESGAEKALVDLVDDGLAPAVVRATAVARLGGYGSEATTRVLERYLEADDALIRHTAVRYLQTADVAARIRQLAPLLTDPVKAVRIEAAIGLAMVPEAAFSLRQRQDFRHALDEYRQIMIAAGDFPVSNLNLGNLALYQGQHGQAEQYYRAALAIAAVFTPAQINLATLLAGQGRNEEAQAILQTVVATNPEADDAWYRLGLLLAGQERYEEAVDFLERATAAPDTAGRRWYNLGLVYQQLHRNTEAVSALGEAIRMAPENPDYHYALAFFFYRLGDLTAAREQTRELLLRRPDDGPGKQLWQRLDPGPAEP